MAGDLDPRIKDVLAKWEAMDDEHRQMAGEWREASRFCYRRSTFDNPSAGQRQDWGTFDNTALHANWQATAQIQGAMMPHQANWFTLHDEDQGFNVPRDERIWFEAAANDLHQMMAAPNRSFYVAVHEALLQTTALGNGPIYLGNDAAYGPWLKALPLAACRFAENEMGEKDAVARCWTMKPQAIVDTYGADAAGPEIAKLADDGARTDLEIIHLVDRRRNGVKGGFAKRKPWRSITVLKEHDVVLDESGYDTMPFAWSRWSRRPGERYGWGLGTEYLTDCRTLDEYALRFLQAAQLAVAPPVMLPGEGLLSEFSLEPFAFNYYDPLKFGLQMPQAVDLGARNIPITKDILDGQRQMVRERWAVDWLDKATERQVRIQFMQNRDDRLALQAPALERATNEMLGPIVAHSFEIYLRQRRFARPPASLLRRIAAGRLALGIGYRSPMTRLQLFGELDAINSTMTFAAQIAQFDPSVRFVVDAVAAIEAVAARAGAPSEIIRSREAIQQSIEAANQQAEQQQQADSLQRGAAAVRDLAHAASMAREPGQASQPRIAGVASQPAAAPAEAEAA